MTKKKNYCIKVKSEMMKEKKNSTTKKMWVYSLVCKNPKVSQIWYV